jgi:hypothetical protein
VISTSKMQPVYSAEIQVTAPCGVMPSKHLKVFVPLYAEYNCQFKNKYDGCCVVISVQSMLTRVFGYVALKHSGIRSSILCLLSQIAMLPKIKYNKNCPGYYFSTNSRYRNTKSYAQILLQKAHMLLFRPARFNVSLPW